jgi:predicted transcriptional regulator
MNTAVLQQDNWLTGLNDNQRKALSLLGQGISSVMVASTLGVSESLISQYIADSRFASEVTARKLKALQVQTDIDNKYATAENNLLDKLLKTIPLITKPMDILRGIQVINATKRRGMSDAPVAQHNTQIVQINLPAAMAAKFITNTANQIVEIQDSEGARSLVTSTPEAVSKFAHTYEDAVLVEGDNYGELNRGGIEQGLASPGLINGSSETAIPTSWQAPASTEDRIKRASEVLSKLAISGAGRERQTSSSGVKGQITADDL